jgi:hypothetical protein
MAERTLTLGELNRATLARQLLLPRQRRPSSPDASPPATPRDATRDAVRDAMPDAVPDATPDAVPDAAVLATVQRVAGLQSQDSRAAAVGLWARAPSLRREQLVELLQRRLLIKGTLMRVTQHLVSAADYLILRPALQPALTRWAEAVLRRRAPELDLAVLAAAARPFFDEPHSALELRRYLHDLHPGADAEAMATAVRVHLPLVQVPVEGALWGVPGNPAFVNAGTWLGRTVPAATGPEALVLRYLAAFGPARVADVQHWSGVARLRDEVERLRPRLRSFRDEQGRELVDLPHAPRPRADRPTPPLLVPEWDSTLLAYADRTRIVPEEHREPVYLADRRIGPAVLIDGFAAATWRFTRERDAAAVVIRPLAPLSDEAGGGGGGARGRGPPPAGGPAPPPPPLRLSQRRDLRRAFHAVAAGSAPPPAGHDARHGVALGLTRRSVRHGAQHGAALTPQTPPGAAFSRASRRSPSWCAWRACRRGPGPCRCRWP